MLESQKGMTVREISMNVETNSVASSVLVCTIGGKKPSSRIVQFYLLD